MNKTEKLIELADMIISFAHQHCEEWDEKHRTDEEALDNSHESYWMEFVEDGEDENLFTEDEFTEAFDIAYDLVNNKGV